MDVYSIHAYEHRGRQSSKEARVAGSKPGFLILKCPNCLSEFKYRSTTLTRIFRDRKRDSIFQKKNSSEPVLNRLRDILRFQIMPSSQLVCILMLKVLI